MIRIEHGFSEHVNHLDWRQNTNQIAALHLMMNRMHVKRARNPKSDGIECVSESKQIKQIAYGFYDQ